MRELDRRQFIGLCAAGSLGLATMVRPRRAAAMGPLLALLVEFSVSVAATVVASLIADYLRSLRDSEHRGPILRTNHRLAEQGFADQRYSTVYCSPANDRRIYYPVVNSHCSCLNFTAPFFNDACGCPPVTMIQGPHMAGLAYAAKMLREGRSSEEAADYLVPMSGSRISSGTPQTGYDGPLVYDSRGARVNVAYYPRTSRSGSVIVKARRHGDHFPVVNDEWGIAFP